MNRKAIIAGVSALVMLACSSSPGWSAGWVDDWIDQKVETSPGYFEGQKRGYYTGGGFSARWNLQNDYLWSVTPPRLKTGCGGIDAFMGGFSFLDPVPGLKENSSIIPPLRWMRITYTASGGPETTICFTWQTRNTRFGEYSMARQNGN